MTREEAIKRLSDIRADYSCFDDEERSKYHALSMAIKALQGDMYCPSCGVRLVPENEYVEPKPYKESDTE